MKIILDINIKCDFEAPKDIPLSQIKINEFIEEIKNDIKDSFRKWYGANVTTCDIVLAQEE